MAKVVLESVGKVYHRPKKPDFSAVKEVSLCVEDKEFLVLVGPSGCGKSTTLRMIAGLEEITQGTIAIDQVAVNELPPKKRDVAMVFQNYALYLDLTVHQNIAFGLELRKYSKKEIRERVKKAAETLGLTEDLLERKPQDLSGGQRQRVALARAIVRKPKVFLLDEPLSNLDARLRVQMRREISKLQKELEATMIYVTHDQVEAMTMGDRIAVMHQGRILQVGKPADIYQFPANLFVAGFIGTPPMNFLEGEIIERGGRLFFHELNSHAGPGSALIPLTPEQNIKLLPKLHHQIILGIRPEHLSLVTKETPQPVRYLLRASVEFLDPLGGETHLQVNTGTHSLCLRTLGQFEHQPDQFIELSIQMEQAHFFSHQDRAAFKTSDGVGFDTEAWQAACKLIL